jgi:hypothetical protein
MVSSLDHCVGIKQQNQIAARKSPVPIAGGGETDISTILDQDNIRKLLANNIDRAVNRIIVNYDELVFVFFLGRFSAKEYTAGEILDVITDNDNRNAHNYRTLLSAIISVSRP